MIESGTAYQLIAMLASPILSLLFLYIYWLRRGRDWQPPIIAVIPLALTSSALLAGSSARSIIAGFANISAEESSGASPLTQIFRRSQEGILWGLTEFALCAIVVGTLAAAIRRHAPVSRSPHSVFGVLSSVAALIGTGVLLGYEHSTTDLLMAVIDPGPATEAITQGYLNDPDSFSRMIGHRLTVIGSAAILITIALIIISLISSMPILRRRES